MLYHYAVKNESPNEIVFKKMNEKIIPLCTIRCATHANKIRIFW